jgi:hypothetical protein
MAYRLKEFAVGTDQVVVWCGLSSNRLRLTITLGDGVLEWSERERMGSVSGAY